MNGQDGNTLTQMFSSNDNAISTMNGDDFKVNIQTQLQELGTTLEKGTYVLEEFKKILHESAKLLETSPSVNEKLPDSRPGPVSDLDRSRQPHLATNELQAQDNPQLNQQTQTALKVEIEQLREELKQQAVDGGAMKATLVKLESEMNDVKLTYRQTEDCKRVLQNRLKQSEEEKKELRVKITELEGRLKNSGVPCNDQDHVAKDKDVEMISSKDDLPKQVADERNAQAVTVKTLQDKLDATTAELETLRQQVLPDAETEKSGLNRSLRQAEDCKQLLQKRLKKSDHQIEEMRAHIAELEKKQNSCSDAGNDLDSVVKEKDAEIARLNRAINQLRVESQSQISDLKRTSRQAEDCKQLLQRRCKRMELQMEELRGQIRDLERKPNAGNDLDSVVKQKDAEIARLKSEMSQLRGDFKQRNERNVLKPGATNDCDVPGVFVGEVPHDVMRFIRRSRTMPHSRPPNVNH